MDHSFETDGCSGWMTWFWRTVLRRDPPWEGCCETHDVAYWQGGTALQRFEADLELARCVAKSGHRYWALAMLVGVRFGGVSWLPLPWRWGYGWTWPRSC